MPLNKGTALGEGSLPIPGVLQGSYKDSWVITGSLLRDLLGPLLRALTLLWGPSRARAGVPAQLSAGSPLCLAKGDCLDSASGVHFLLGGPSGATLSCPASWATLQPNLGCPATLGGLLLPPWASSAPPCRPANLGGSFATRGFPSATLGASATLGGPVAPGVHLLLGGPSWATLSGPASWATLSGPASWATLPGPASRATFSGPASWASLSGPASWATFSGPASWASLSGPASWATNRPSLLGFSDWPRGPSPLWRSLLGLTLPCPASWASLSGPASRATLPCPASWAILSRAASWASLSTSHTLPGY